MGVFLYSSRIINTDKVEEVLRTRGHKGITVESNHFFKLIHAEKILTPAMNYLSGKELGGANDDFIVGVGTYFYDGTFGVEALKKIYNNLEIVLKDNPVYGNWAFCVRKDDTTYIVNDMNGTLRVYYCQNYDSVTVSTSLLSVIATIKDPKFDKVRLGGFLANVGAKEIPFVEGVENFNPRKYLVVKDGCKPQWVEKTVPETRRIDNLSEASDYVQTLISDQIKQLKAIGDEEVSVELSAGLDSRLIACIIKNGGFNYNFVHFPLYGPDKDIAYLVAKGLNKEILLQTDSRELAPEEIPSHYGEFDACFNYFNHHANPRRIVKNRFQFTGALGECLNTPEIYEMDIKLMNDPRIEVLLPLLTYYENRELVSDKWQKEWMDYIIGYFESYGFKSGKKLSEREQQDFTMDLFGMSDFRTISGYQYHINRYSIYNEWHFNHFINDIAFDTKSGRKLSLALIKALDKELADFPFISRLITRRESVTDTWELPAQYKSYRKYKEMMPTWMKNIYYGRKIKSFAPELMDKIDMDIYRNLINVKQLCHYPALYKEQLQRLYSIDVLRKEMGISLD